MVLVYTILRSPSAFNLFPHFSFFFFNSYIFRSLLLAPLVSVCAYLLDKVTQYGREGLNRDWLEQATAQQRL